jgi:hypothetical protein
MQKTEHRHLPRTKLERLAYIHIEPNNGGIVLDVSGEGLAFHSISRVERNGPLRFSLQEHNRRIDVCGELVWTDEAQNVGGLRFTALTSEARKQIQHWMNNSESAVEERCNANLGSEVLPALSVPGTRRFISSGHSRNYLSPTLIWLMTRMKLKLRGFSGGLATGVLFSALAASIILFFYGHRRQFGESLIRIGERLATNRDSPLTRSSTSGAVVLPLIPVSKLAMPAAAKPVPAKMKAPVHTTAAGNSGMLVNATPVPQQIPNGHDLRFQTPPKATPIKPPELQSSPIPAREPVSQAGNFPASFQGSSRTASDLASASPLTAILALPPPSLTKADVVVPTHTELAAVIHDRALSPASDSRRRMFFDVGRFKQEESALHLSGDLAQLGLRTSIVRRGRLWTSSYQVLVGPYNNEEDERTINSNLRLHGFKTRPFETGSRDFAFRTMLMIGRSKLSIGDCVISWESYVADAKVKFTQEHEIVATAEGQWIRKSGKFSRDEYVYQNQADGFRPLLEIHFAGFDRALMFRDLP